MSEKGIMEWFEKRRSESVNIGARSHTVAVLDTVTELGTVIGSMSASDRESALKGIERVMLCEREADSIEDRLSAEIGRGDLTAGERGDLLHFVRKMDSIASWAKEAALHVQLVLETGAAVPKEVWDEIGAMAKELAEETRLLVSAIGTYIGDAMATIKTLDAVSDQERIVDGKYYESVKHAHLSAMDARAVLLVTEVINAVEMAADCGKECGDVLHILVVSKGEIQ